MWYLFIAILLAAEPACAGRCLQYAQNVRTEHFREFGPDYPYWYAVGQLQQESGCRNIISNDGVGSQGVAQITWKVWGKFLKKNGITNMAGIKNQLRGQALINKDSWNQAKPKKLWIAWQIYNGGRLVLKEIERAGSPEWSKARSECRRKVITFSNGQKIDACEINYEYSWNVYKYGNQYRIGPDSDKFLYW
ncbi:MAG: hypothetical protein WC869_15770 [Phycisphaerae bacterium]|jgi:hypothetical protein